MSRRYHNNVRHIRGNRAVRLTHIPVNVHADRQTDRQLDRRTDRHTDEHTERQSDRQTDRQTKRQTTTRKHTHRCTHTNSHQESRLQTQPRNGRQACLDEPFRRPNPEGQHKRGGEGGGRQLPTQKYLHPIPQDSPEK